MFVIQNFDLISTKGNIYSEIKKDGLNFVHLYIRN
jgi:hypothetical protein